jgi:hypothetical protein
MNVRRSLASAGFHLLSWMLQHPVQGCLQSHLILLAGKEKSRYNKNSWTGCDWIFNGYRVKSIMSVII